MLEPVAGGDGSESQGSLLQDAGFHSLIRWLRLAVTGLLVAAVGLEAVPASAEGGFRVIRLSEEGLPESDVHLGWIYPGALRATADGGRIVYLHDARADESFELFSVRRDGSERVRLSPDLPPGVRVDQFEVTPDGAQVVFRMGNASENRFGLYAVPVDGSPSTARLLYIDPDPAVSVQMEIEVSPDSNAVVFRVRGEGVSPATRVLRVALGSDTRDVVELFPGALTTDPASRLWISPDGSSVLVQARGLYSVPVWGTVEEIVQLDEGEAAGPERVWSPILFAPDSARVLFGKYGTLAEGRPRRLYSVPTLGPGAAAVQVSPNGYSDVTLARVSPDSTLLCLRALAIPGGLAEIFVAPIAGPAAAATRLSIPLFGSTGAGACEFTPDSATIVYSGWMDDFGDREVLSVSVAGPPEAAVRISLPQDPPGEYLHWQLVPDGTAVLYSGLYGGTDNWRLQIVPLSGPAAASQPLCPPFRDPQGTWAGTRVAPGGRVAVQFADFQWAGQYELFHQSLVTPLVPGDFMNPPLVAGGSVLYPFVWMPDGYGIVYRADAETDEKFELYIADALVFADGFESGDTSRWLVSTDS